MRLRTLLTMLPLAALACIGTSCQQRPYPVYFHTQASGIEEGARALFVFNGDYYTRVPVLTQDYFEGFRSFLAEDGSYGVELFLKPQYRQRLENISIDCNGRKLLPVVNGLVFEPQHMNLPITDGELVIWSGLNGYDLKQMSRTIKPLEPDIEKARYLDKNPRTLPPRPKSQNQVKDHTGRVIGELYQG